MPPLGRAKLGWAAGLLASQRGVGWNLRARGIPARAPVGRWRFVLHQLVHVVWMYVALDAVCALLMRAHFRDPADSIARLGLLRTLALECAAGLQSYLANNWLFTFWGAVFVGTGVHQEKVPPVPALHSREPFLARGGLTCTGLAAVLRTARLHHEPSNLLGKVLASEPPTSWWP